MISSQGVDDQQENPPYGTNLTYEPSAYTRIHATSGTTGRRLKCLDTRESWAWFTFCWQEIYRAIGIDSDDRVFAAFGFGPFVGFWAGFEAAQQIGALAIPAGAQSSEQRLDWILESNATVLLSTPTYSLRLIEVARDKGIDLGFDGARQIVVLEQNAVLQCLVLSGVSAYETDWPYCTREDFWLIVTTEE